MLQCGTDDRDSLQLVEAQVQLHQPSHIKSIRGDALICELVVSHPEILQLSEAAQESLGYRVNGVKIQVELMQMFREIIWNLFINTTF